MVLGDWFTFGVYVEEPKTLPAHLATQLGEGFELFNVSSPGWGVDQMYLAYRKFVEVLDPDVVVLVYINDDVRRAFESEIEGEKPSFLSTREGYGSGQTPSMARTLRTRNSWTGFGVLASGPACAAIAALVGSMSPA